MLIFSFDDGPKRLDNCSWEELRQVIDYLAEENERLRGGGSNGYIARVDDELYRNERRYPPGFALTVWTLLCVGIVIWFMAG